MCEDFSVVTHPASGVIFHTVQVPVYKQYRVIDIRDDRKVVAMTENGEVIQGLRIAEQKGLWKALTDHFANGRGSIRVLVIEDSGEELAVDYKVVHAGLL
jgi:Eukaryotic elongation factor 5A hypusine, DNA-binding OB fold